MSLGSHEMTGIIIGLGTSMVCSCLCLYFTWRSVRRLTQHARTEAIIARYRISHVEGTYFPVLRFVTECGDQTTAISPYGSSGRPWPRGTTVRITYDPHNPRLAEILSFGPLWLAPLFFACFAIGFAFAAWSTYASAP